MCGDNPLIYVRQAVLNTIYPPAVSNEALREHVAQNSSVIKNLTMDHYRKMLHMLLRPHETYSAPRAPHSFTTIVEGTSQLSALKPLSRPGSSWASPALRESGSTATVIPTSAPLTPANFPYPTSRLVSSPAAPLLPPGTYRFKRKYCSFEELSGSSDVPTSSTQPGTVRGLSAAVQDGGRHGS